MSFVLRELRAAEAEKVVKMVQSLARHVGTDIMPKLTAQSLNTNQDLVDIVVAEEEGNLIGACLSLMTFSTWRGAKGLYIVDLFVEPHARGRNAGLQLLKLAAARGHARGASFIKLEVDQLNKSAARFYERLGFTRKEEDRLFILEQEMLNSLLA